MGKLISVIIPAYNAQETIEKSVKSVKGEDIEIIIVIDGSTDNTLKKCNEMKKENKNIEIIEQKNSGVLEARKAGIKKAKGKYIMFLDSDDCYFDNTITKIKELINKYKEPDLIRFRYQKEPDCYAQYKYIEQDEEYIEKTDFGKKVYPMFLNSYMLNALWTNCIKKEIIENIKIPTKNRISYGEDLLYNLEIFSNIQNVVFTNEILYRYIYNEKSETNIKELGKLLNHLESAIEVYSLLHIYLDRWNINTIENINIVNNRINKESKEIIKIMKDIL